MDAQTPDVDRILNTISENTIRDPDNLAAFVYGSRVEGFSNKYSDLDVCIITKNESGTSFQIVGNLEVDLVKMPLRQLRKIIADVQGQGFNYDSILWCHRLSVGRPIYDKRNTYRNLKGRIDLRSICKNLITHYSANSISALNDSLGALESGDFETAVITARLATEAAALSFVSSKGIINPSVKWIYRYLLKEGRTLDDETIKMFSELEMVCKRNAEELGDYIRKATSFANSLTAQAQKSLWDNAKGADRY